MGRIACVAALVLVGLLAASAPATACATCFGDPDSAATQGLNNAILVLLGVVGVVQGGFIALFVGFWRRARRRRDVRSQLQIIQGGAR